MKRYFVMLALVLSFSPLMLNAQSPAFNTAKSLDIFHSIVREISLFYVDTVEMDKLVYSGIEAMLSSMDPYTEFIPEEENEDLEMMTTGSYGGVGALIKKKEGEPVVISEPYANSPIAKAGLVAGDSILAINGESTLALTADQCSANMKGEPGTQVNFKIKRLVQQDTLDFTVTREKVHVSDVSLACVLQDSIAYIGVSGFTQGGSQEVRNAILQLKSQADIKGIVLDLRGNGGGLMEEAINMLSIFLPRHTMVVSAKGRIEQANREYFTKEEPLDTTTPLLVMVNGNSASSSEIVAGAIQDLKRGRLVGTRTFGKGLVQAIRPLSFNSNLKITTAKYYIPSGRCVQAIDYSNRHEDGSLDRKEDGGIMPDVEIKIPSYNRVTVEIVARDYLHDYSLEYFRHHPTIEPAESFTLTDQEYEDFVTSTAAKEFDDRTGTEIMLSQFKEIAKAEGYDTQLSEEIASLSSRLVTDKISDLRHYKDEIKPLLEEEICCRYYYQEGRMRNYLKNDDQLIRALSFFTEK